MASHHFSLSFSKVKRIQLSLQNTSSGKLSDAIHLMSNACASTAANEKLSEKDE